MRHAGQACSYILTATGTPTIDLGSSASGVMTINTLVDAAGNQIARIPNVAIGDGQPPIVFNKDIKIIGLNQLMVNGTEPLRADTATFTDLRVDHDGDNTGTPGMCTPRVCNKTCADGSVIALTASCPDRCTARDRDNNCTRTEPDAGTRTCSGGTCSGGSNTNPNATPFVERNITNVSRGSNANSLLITFDGEPVPTAAKGTVDIKNTLTNFNDNTAKTGTSTSMMTIPDDGTDDTIVADGQPPIVFNKDIKIIGPNQLMVNGTEPLRADTATFTDLRVDHDGDNTGTPGTEMCDPDTTNTVCTCRGWTGPLELLPVFA